MYAAILLTLAAISFYGIRAEGDEPTTLPPIEPCPKTWQALQPKFLTEVTEEARQQFEAIIANKSLSMANIEDELNKWAAEQGEQIQSQFNEAKRKLQSMFAEKKKAIANSSLSNAAKEAFAKIDEIVEDKGQTAEQHSQQIKAFMNSLSEDVRNEMKEFMKSEDLRSAEAGVLVSFVFVFRDISLVWFRQEFIRSIGCL
uniref:SXP/RAL-2 family protein Ani s 5-like cation-binding domain-containing protein n=1 Tax=Parascaris univalens TaxID=6257 RepID=A0A915BNM9_PARUN